MKPIGPNFAIADRRMANTVKWYLTPPKDINMRLPNAVKDCVVYLGKDFGDANQQKIQYRGTGFLVAKPSQKVSGASFLFLVTAKHVADKLANSKCYLRANAKDGKSVDLLFSDNAKWYFHPTDSAAVVALIPLGLSQEAFDFQAISSESILTEKIRLEKGIGIGDSIFITGLFVYHKGHAKNIPILRTGNIAMIPDERVQTSFGAMEAYLIESRSIGGLSGSPIFCVSREENGTATMYLMGLIHGHWAEDSASIIDESQGAGTKVKVNVGIAIATPAYKILDILNTGELAQMLEKYEADELMKNSPVPDTHKPL